MHRDDKVFVARLAMLAQLRTEHVVLRMDQLRRLLALLDEAEVERDAARARLLVE